MSVGISVQKVDVDGRAGGLVLQFWKNLDELKRFKAWLDDSTHNDAFLTGLGYSSGEITTLRAGISDLGDPTVGLYAIAHGVGSKGVGTIGQVAAANNFFFNAKNLSGVDYSG